MANASEERCGGRGALGAIRTLQQQHCIGGCDSRTPLLTMICLWEDSSSWVVARPEQRISFRSQLLGVPRARNGSSSAWNFKNIPRSFHLQALPAAEPSSLLMMLSELVFSPRPVDPGFQLPLSCVQAHTWPQCSVVQHRSLCMCIISLFLSPNQQGIPAPKASATHPNPSTSHHHGCPVDALSPMSIAAKQKQESRFHSEMYRATKLGLEEKHKQECAESTFLHLPSLKMWAVIHSINSIWNRYPYMEQGGCFPSGSAGRDPICQCRRHKRLNLWVRKITSSRKWQSTSVLLPGKSLGQRSLVGYSPWGLKEPDMTEHTHIQNR